MAGINLLPIDLSSKRGSAKASENIKKLVIILGGIFSIAVLISIIFIVFLKSEINASEVKQKNYKQNIQSLEGTEQKLFLIKDRIDKIQITKKDADAGAAFAPLNKTLLNLPAGVAVSSIDVSSLGTKFSVTSTNSLDAAKFLNSLVASGIYKQLILTNFTFSPEVGYKVSFEGT